MRSSRLDKLKEKRQQLDAQIKDAEARQREQQRKDDARRKIIAGALALEHTEKNPDGEFGRKMLMLLDEYVTRKRDRELMGLPVKADNDNVDLKSEFDRGNPSPD